MANRWATQSFVIQLASGASHHVEAGALRDSAHAAVVAAPGLFSSSPVTVHPRQQAYLNAYPSAEVS